MNKTIFTLQELATLTHSKLVGEADYEIHSVADIEAAGNQDASFLSNPIYDRAMRVSSAGVVFVSPSVELIQGRNFLISEDPSRAFQTTVEAFYGSEVHTFSGFNGIHPSAVIHETASIGKNVTIGPQAVIDKDVVIGDNTTIGAGCYVGFQVSIGSQSFIHPRVTIRERCRIGNRVIIQPGAVIGSCGFGYTMDNQGRHIKLNQVGIVIIEDDVEIGANTTIDRSRFKATVIGKGSKIDNLVQIGHGVTIGAHNIIVAQTGIAGSTKTGKYVVMAGHVAIAGHLSIADKVIIAAKAGVSSSIKEAGKYGGMPCVPLNKHNRNAVFLRNIETYIDQIKELQKKVESLQKNSSLN
ncbi:MAG TPA: UDP-3-O-(3-hydroxymyristoyl)glucosamine N-acyltransferase [Parachlamydiaceae bacterium]|nr:UDP-3-O-(3-hydroxymyristoyl)glucosamine N-acyltransferase [Parachlamydiaceae bacterium]